MPCDADQPAATALARPVAGALLLVAMFVALAALSMLPQSVTYDERANLGLGSHLLYTRAWHLWPCSHHHPPLSFYVSALPSLLPAPLTSWARPLTLARWAMILTGIGAAALVYLWATESYGPAAGMMALTLTAFSPNLLAHVPLVTPDGSLTCMVVAAGYALWRYGRRPSHGRAWITGLAIGLALLTKFTALLLLPFWLAAVVVGGWRRRWTGLVADLAAVGIAILFVINAGYLWTGVGKAIDVRVFRSELMRHWCTPWLSRLAPTPFLMGMDFQLAHAGHGEWGFLMGELSNKGWPQYFLVAFLLKTPIAFQALLVAAIVLAIRRPGASGPRPKEEPNEQTRHGPPNAWLMALTAIGPALWLFAYMSLFSRIDIGFRYVLPMLPLLHVAASRLRSFDYRRPRRARAMILVALAVYVAESTSVFPWYLCFFNAWIGGPTQGYKYLIDSNLDWGQGARAAQRYLQDHYPAVLPRPGRHFVHGRIVLNANALQGLSPEERQTYAWLRQFEPVGHIGYSYLIYDVPLAAVPHNLHGAEGHAYLDCVYTSFRRFARADDEFRYALECARGDVGGLLALAHIYQAKGRRGRVRQVLERMPNDPRARAMLKGLEAGR